MKQFYSSVLILLGILPAGSQDQRPAGACRLETKYDGSVDTTTVHCDLYESAGEQGRLVVRANASFRGKEPDGTAKFWLGLASFRGGATRRTQRLFQEAATLHLSLDSDRLEIPVIDYRNDFYELNRLLAESARAEIGRDDLRKLLEAGSLEGRWGGAGFKLSDAAHASLKDFITHQVFAVNNR